MVRPRFVADAVEVALPTEPEQSVLLGMPHLSGTGLSESWLLKDLGHRHWTALAKAAGMDVPDFRDDAGQPVYAAFCAIRIEGARFDQARENGRLAIRTSLSRVSRSQVLSRHDLFLDGQRAGRVEMVSAFVKRTGGSNHSIARVSIGGLKPLKTTGSDLAGLAASFRSRRISRHFGFDLSGAADTGAGYSFDPCPAQDFNGAGFLYFTSFLGFVDRAEWQHSPSLEKPIQEREAYYYSNVDAGERLRVVLAAARPSYRWWQVFSEGPDTLLADVFTRRTSDGTA